MNDIPDARQREAQRQELLVRWLWRDPAAASLQDWLNPPPQRIERGLNAYGATGGAGAERALASVFPSVAALIGADSFAALARAYRQAHPPLRGDLAWLGQHLADFIAADAQLADVPYLADVARVEWLLDRAEQAADAEPQLYSLQRLADTDPDGLWLQLAPGAAGWRSAWPVVTIRQAHAQPTDGSSDPLAAAREALARGDAECAFVWRQGFRSRVCILSEPDACFVQALLQRQSLAQALDQAGEGFAFEPWLVWALSHGVLLGALAEPLDRPSL